MLTGALAAMGTIITYSGVMDQGRHSSSLAPKAQAMQATTEDPARSRRGLHGSGGKKDVRNESNIHSTQEGRGDLLNLHGGQEERQTKTSAQPAVDQYPPTGPPLQDDYYEGGEGSDNQGLLHGDNRYDRLLLGRTGSRRRSTIPQLRVERSDLLLPVPTIWSQAEPDVHHQAVPQFYRSPIFTRSSSDDIHRRHSDSWGHRGSVRGERETRFGSTKRSRSHYQRGQVFADPLYDDRVPGFSPGLSEHGDFLPEEKIGQYVQGFAANAQQGASDRQAARLYSRQNQFSGRRYALDEGSHLVTPPIGKELGQRYRMDGPSNYDLDDGSQGGPTLVERQPSGYEWSNASSSYRGPANGDGRFELRLGRLDGDTQRTGTMGRTIPRRDRQTPHQLQGIASSSLRARRSSDKIGEPNYRTGDRQHYGNALSSTLWRKNSEFVPAGRQNLSDMPFPKYTAHRESSGWSQERLGGQNVPAGCDSSNRLSASSQDFPNGPRPMGSLLNRSFRDFPKPTNLALREFSPAAARNVDQFDGTQLEARIPLGSSSLLDDHKDNTEDRLGGNGRRPGGSVMGSAAMEPAATSPVNYAAAYSPNEIGFPSSPSQARRDESPLGYRRLEDIRFVLRKNKVAEETIKQVMRSWAEATNKSYDGPWKSWTDFACNKGQDPSASNTDLLGEWLATSIDNGAKEGTYEKFTSVIKDTWNVMHDPEALLSKMKRTAAKTNGRKSKGLSHIWNLYYLHSYVLDTDITKLDFRDLTGNLIMKLRMHLGWRSGDLTGIYLDHSFKRTREALSRPGIYIRSWNLKTTKGAWTGWSFVPDIALDGDYKEWSLSNTLDLYISRLGDDGEKVRIEHNAFAGDAPLDATPLLQYRTSKKGTFPKFKKLGESTIANYFSEHFLDNVRDEDGRLGAQFKAHSCRNAVASLLAAIGVPNVDIAGHMQTSAESLANTYIRPIIDPSEYPQDCIAKHTSMVGKMLVPSVHYLSLTIKKKDHCDCSVFLASNASSV